MKRCPYASGLVLLVALLSIALAAPLAAAEAVEGPPDLLLILDASGSMWGQIGGENKIVIARRVLGDLLGRLPDGSQVGLVAYGHRREGDCGDVETVVAPGPLDRQALTARIGALNPKGKTPITAAIGQGVDLARSRPGPSTVVLVSDGLETCGGDPCRAVAEAKAAGVDFRLHVVGFDVGEEDVSQLECAAQAGGGLYFEAADASQLAAALERAVAAPAGEPAGRLSVAARADGAPIDSLVRVTPAGGGDEVASGRTYTGADTNPRTLALPPGAYDVEVRPLAIRGAAPQRFEGVLVEEGEPAERTADFSSGELVIRVTRNGELSDATVQAFPAGGETAAASGRTYTRPNHNPIVLRVAAGVYDVEVGSVEIAGRPSHRFEGVRVEPGGRTERAHAFESGTLRVGAVRDGALVDATVSVEGAGGGGSVASGRTYESAGSNPKAFVLAPGSYRVTLTAVKLPGKPKRELEVTVGAGETVERSADFGG